jgi:hypothetical protein
MTSMLAGSRKRLRNIVGNSLNGWTRPKVRGHLASPNISLIYITLSQLNHPNTITHTRQLLRGCPNYQMTTRRRLYRGHLP